MVSSLDAEAMQKLVILIIALGASTMQLGCAQSASPQSASGQSQPTADAPVVKQENGDVFMWEVPSKPAKQSKAEVKEWQQTAEQARSNAAELMMENQAKNVLPPPSDGTAPGAITPPYLPFSTVPGGPYGGSGSVMTPFNIRNYSYGGNSQSFGAPIFSGVEVPNPALQYPAGMPFGGAPTLMQVTPPGASAGLGAPGATPSPFPPGVTTIVPTPTTVIQQPTTRENSVAP